MQAIPAAATLSMLLACAAHAGDAPASPKPLKVPGAESIRDIRYLPAWRYSGDPGPRRDYELVLDLHLPAGPRTRRPLVMYVHGGAYSAGHKDEAYQAGLVKVLVDGGFAVGTLNYILNPRGIFPQAWWDFAEAARFLRTQADVYGLDINAFGAIGISAGGWLITTSGHADGRIFARWANQYVGYDELDPTTLAEKKPKDGEHSFLRPTLAPATAFPGISGRWQALAYDFASCSDRANGFSPSLLAFVSTARTEIPPALAAAGVDWTPAILTNPFWAAKGVHAPKMTRDGHEGERSIARTLDGAGEAQLAEVIRDWFRRELTGASARAPVPEIWPAERVVQGPVEVTMVVPDPASAIRYTTDGSDPGPRSPVYDKPFQIAPGTRVRAFAELAGRRPSRIAEAHFVAGPALIRIATPHGIDLPPAQTGQPYGVRFAASAPGARWSMAGDLRPVTDGKTGEVRYPNGLRLEDDGTLAGTPSAPGVHWVQVWTNQRPGQVATHRDYRLVVSGPPLADAAAASAGGATGDANIQLANLRDWPEAEVALLRERLASAGIPPVLEEIAKGRIMLLVPQAHAAAARTILAAIRRDHPDRTALEPTP